MKISRGLAGTDILFFKRFSNYGLVSKSVDKKIDFLSQQMMDVKGQMLIMNNLAKAVENIEQGIKHGKDTPVDLGLPNTALGIQACTAQEVYNGVMMELSPLLQSFLLLTKNLQKTSISP